MQRARLSDSPSRHVELGRYLFRMLNTRTETHELAEQFRLVQEALAASVTAFFEARFERSVVYGRLLALDADWDAAISDFNRELLAKVRGNRDDLVYRSFFPTGRITETIRAPFSTAPVVAAQFTELAQAHPEIISQNMLQSIVALAPQIAAGLTSLAGQDALVSKNRTSVTVAHITWIKVYNATYLEIKLLFPEKPGLVESFFLREQKTADKETDEETGAEI